MKKSIKLIAIFLIVFLVFANISTICFADDALDGMSTSEMDPQNQGIRDDSSAFYKKVGVILGAIRAIGILVSVGALIAIGIKQMTASVEEKADRKQAMLGYVIGAVLVMAMTTLPSIIFNFTEKL